MEYFVSIENKPYHHWQIEFLIQSFKLNRIEDKLVIGVAENDEPKTIDFTYNFKNWNRAFTHHNYGKEKNRGYSVYLALKEKLIKQPFVLIDPDMMLVKPLKEIEANISFQLDTNFRLADGFNYISKLLEIQKSDVKPESLWIPLGKVMYFNGVPIEFFERVLKWLETLEDWDERFSWIMALIEYSQILRKYEGVVTYEMGLNEMDRLCNFIHYNHGFLPTFHKNKYRYENGFVMGDLFSDIFQIGRTTSTDIFQNIVKMYLESAPKTKQKLNLNKFRVGAVRNVYS